MKVFFPTTLSLLFCCLLIACKTEQKVDATKTSESSYEISDGMVKLPGASYIMGTTGLFQTPYGPKQFDDEKPQHKVTVKGFWIDQTEVTNAQFAEFVKATNYVTFAERDAKKEDFPAEALEALPPFPFSQGSIIFIQPKEPVGDPNAEGEYMNWWKWEPTANWKSPGGKGTTINGKENEPVVCVVFEDAQAYATWAKKRLPTEAEWEYAARGNHVQTIYTWGDKVEEPGKPMCNHWQGKFPNENSMDDGFLFASPVKSYPPNDFQLHDMAGNVWEICSDFYDPHYFRDSPSDNPQGPKTWVNRDTGESAQGAPHHVTKGGSFLCHASYCMRYRAGARHSQDTQSPTNHTGFRCIKDL